MNRLAEILSAADVRVDVDVAGKGRLFEAAGDLFESRHGIARAKVVDNLLAHAVTNEIVKGYILMPKLIHQQYQVGIGSASYLNT